MVSREDMMYWLRVLAVTPESSEEIEINTIETNRRALLRLLRLLSKILNLSSHLAAIPTRLHHTMNST